MADCIVIGGGLIGMATARELALAGLKVTVVERGELGMESSWAAGGILTSLCPWQEPAIVNDLSRYCREMYEHYAGELFKETGIDTGWQRSGLLLLDSPDQDAILSWAARENLGCEVLDHAGIRAMEPLLEATTRQAVWIPAIAQVWTPRLIRAMRSSLAGLGVRILENTAVLSIHLRQGRFDSIATVQGPLAAETAVVAGGAWSAGLLAQLGYTLALEPVRGQILCLKSPVPCIRTLLVRDGYYLIPRLDGHLLIGSTVEYSGYDKRTTTEARDRLAAIIPRFSPALEAYPLVHQWAGLRPATADGLPLICQVPGIGGLYLNTGHFRNGILQAPGSARLLVDILLSRASFMPVDAFTCRDVLSVRGRSIQAKNIGI
ncbi:MAG: glycine oxidase ThiO [Gammaproteobacteria bacterium RBG_16_51_14]|nr:MAG: glycine oxidase ThiO [Gammaproteobacteria bacterium RBG_16_51_14]